MLLNISSFFENKEGIFQCIHVYTEYYPYDLKNVLKARKEAKKPLSVSELWQISVGVAAGLSHIHGLHLLQRDLKPANILLKGGNMI